MLQFVGSQRVRHNWATEQQQQIKRDAISHQLGWLYLKKKIVSKESLDTTGGS